MSTITKDAVMTLRERTGAGLIDCKRALTDSNGDMEEAVSILRKKGVASAAKKAGRSASEGIIAQSISADNSKGILVEVNCETDFVAKNDDFVDFSNSVAAELLGDPSADLEEKRTAQIAKIGENMSLRRTNVLSVSNGIIAGYIHNAVNDNLGKIGVIISLESNADKSALKKLGKELAMHIAATSPSSISVNDLSPDIVERERRVLIDQAMSSGKPEDIAKKMVEGRLKKFYSEVVLLEQTFVMDGETKVVDAINKLSKELGADIQINNFTRFNLGEGIEKDEKNFADEVAEQLSN